MGAGRPLARERRRQTIAAARDRALRTAEAGQAHPSILAWTLTNEAPGQGFPAQQRVRRADGAARCTRLDPSRPVAADLWGSELPRSDGPLFSELDAIGVTDYIGWYERPTVGAAAQAALAERPHRAACAACSRTSRSSSPSSARSAARASPAARFGGLRFQAEPARAAASARCSDEPGSAAMLVWSLRDYALRPDFVGGSIAARRPGLTLSPGINEKGLYDFAGRAKPSLPAVRRAFDATFGAG